MLKNNFQVMKKFADEMNTESGEETVKDFSAEDLYILKTMFLALEAAIDEIQLKTVTDEGYDKGKKSLTMPGSFIFDLLLKAEVSYNLHYYYSLVRLRSTRFRRI